MNVLRGKSDVTNKLEEEAECRGALKSSVLLCVPGQDAHNRAPEHCPGLSVTLC